MSRSTIGTGFQNPDRPPDSPPASRGVGCYQDVIAATDGLAYRWRLDESAGTSAAEDLAGVAGTYVNTPTLGVSGPVDGSAITLVAASSQYVSLSTLGTLGSRL